jgi:hypothetical protein
MAAFAWPTLGHRIINAVGQVTPDVDFTVPPSPRAAGFANRAPAGSLNATRVTREQAYIDRYGC